MRLPRTLLLLLLAGGLVSAQEDAKEELTQYSVVEIANWITAFTTTYRKGAPEEDAIAALVNLKKAYRYVASKGDQAAKEERKAQEKIIHTITRGLRARKRPLVTLECARVLGELGDKRGNKQLVSWLGKVLDEKSPNPQWVEFGYRSLAWIGAQDSRSMDLAIKYATTGKHLDTNVTSQALRACYEWRLIKPKVRKDLFKKILNYMGGLYSGWKNGDVKRRATYETRYRAVEENGMRALNELAGAGVKFPDPPAALKWWHEHKNDRWSEPYIGPRFRKKAAPAKAEGKAAEKDEKRPEGKS